MCVIKFDSNSIATKQTFFYFRSYIKITRRREICSLPGTNKVKPIDVVTRLGKQTKRQKQIAENLRGKTLTSDIATLILMEMARAILEILLVFVEAIFLLLLG